MNDVDPLKQEHHYLPQFYQRRWVGPDGKLTVFSRPHQAVVAKRRSPRATGKEAGLYAVPIAPLPEQNALEDRFWRTLDQWGADALVALEKDDPAGVAPLDRERWAVVLLSMMFRDPWSVARINQSARDHYTTGFAEFPARYDELRAPHEPEAYEEFVAAFDRPGLSEFGAQILRSFATNKAVRSQLLAMDWQVVTISDASVPLLTSDRPVIRFKGLKEADGLLILPLGPSSFFVAYNRGPLDMRSEIHESIVHGRFLEAMNEYVVQSAVRNAYGSDDSQLAVVEQHLRRDGDPVLPRW
jgi:hypothetical protein